VFGCLVWVGHTGFVETTPSSYKGHRYSMEIISHCVWLYHRSPLSLREVEEMMLAHGVLVTYESIHQWCRKFGQIFANGLRRRRARPGNKWHLDEVFIKIKGKTHYSTCGGRSTRTAMSWTSWSPPGVTPGPPPGSSTSC
jgi:hypothetical protein